MAFNKKRKDISMLVYVLYLLDNDLADMSEEEILGSLKKGEITRRQLRYLSHAIGGKDLGEKQAGDKEKLDAYLDAKKIDGDSLKRKLDAVIDASGGVTRLSEMVDKFTKGDHDELLDYLLKLKKQFYLKRTKQRNRIQFDRISDYAKDKPELMDKLTAIDNNIFVDEPSARISGGFANILTYFKELSNSRLRDYDKRFAVAPAGEYYVRNAVEKVKGSTAFTGSPFQVTPAFERFMRNSTLNIEEFKPRKVKPSLVLMELVKQIDGNKLDDYSKMNIEVRGRDMRLTSALRSIRNEEGYKGDIMEKTRFLRKILDGGDATYQTALRKVLRDGDVKVQRSRIPKDHIDFLQRPREIDASDEEEDKRKKESFFDTYFNGDDRKGYNFARDLRRNDEKKDVREAIDAIDLSRYPKAEEILVSQIVAEFFDGMMTEEVEDLPTNLSVSARKTLSSKLNDGVFSSELNLADYLETIAQIQNYYVDHNKPLIKANRKYINDEMEYDDLIKEYEKAYTQVRNGFRDDMLKRVSEIHTNRSEEDIREIINRSFNVQRN